MPRRKAPAIAVSLLSLLVSIACGCGPELPFYKINDMAARAPDERVIIGEVRFANGDVRDLLPEHSNGSAPRFSYDLYYVRAPETEKWNVRGRGLGPTGGVFAVRVKRQTVYLDSHHRVDELRERGRGVVFPRPAQDSRDE
jgi:hypothetical protein